MDVEQATEVLDPANLGFARRWYEAHVERFNADSMFRAGQELHYGQRALLGGSLLEIRDRLAVDGDVRAFSDSMRRWSVQDHTSFNGATGQMLINQLAKHSRDNQELAGILSSCQRAPASDAEAAEKIASLLAFIKDQTGDAKISVNNVPYMLSYFWSFENSAHPTIWPSAKDFIEFCTGFKLTKDDPVVRYQQFVDLVRLLDADTEKFLRVASWWSETHPYFLDDVLVERCGFGGRWPEIGAAGLINAHAMVLIAKYLGSGLQAEVGELVGSPVSGKYPSELLDKATAQPRGDLWVDWRDFDRAEPGIRIWINENGASIGVRPGHQTDGAARKSISILNNASVLDFDLIGARNPRLQERVGYYAGDTDELMYAKWYDPAELSTLDLRTELETVIQKVRPLLAELRSTMAVPASPDVSNPLDLSDELAPLVVEFREKVYSAEANEKDRVDRGVFAALLAPEAISRADPAALRMIWNTGRYGGTGPMSVLNTSVRDADPDELERILDTFAFVCWGDGSDADRIDKVLDSDSNRYVKGLGESVTMKLLSVCHPERYLQVYPLQGPQGKNAMLSVLGMAALTAGTRGERQVEANGALLGRLSPLFQHDLIAMSKFLYWLLSRRIDTVTSGESTTSIIDDIDPVVELADELLIDESFLNELVSLLKDKGQIILYGPPGTGKTYLARKLAELLTPDPTRRSLVQFHPSTSYEDFFEGYRPETDPNGSMTYRLTPGPLALMSARAALAPGIKHVMVIDEINRANLPKVFGELLFLLEYRDERINTLYRPEDTFELPKDLWFIGTMNTADRSIALIDAALRRRFYFVPTFPNEGPMEGLLDRWLAEANEPGWVGELVTMVNDDLTAVLGRSDLQLGPSYFMKRGLNEDLLKQIWRYSIEPFIEDQFFADPVQIARFRFDAVLARYKSDLASPEATAQLP